MGYMVSHRGIELNPEKLDTIERMKSPTYHKEVQSLNERLTMLSRFLTKSGDKPLPFFQVLLVNKKLNGRLSMRSIQSLKQYLRMLPPLPKPSNDNALSFYISINLVVVTSILVKEMTKCQTSVYYYPNSIQRFK